MLDSSNWVHLAFRNTVGVNSWENAFLQVIFPACVGLSGTVGSLTWNEALSRWLSFGCPEKQFLSHPQLGLLLGTPCACHTYFAIKTKTNEKWNHHMVSAYEARIDCWWQGFFPSSTLATIDF